ncbi:MAG: insulinase family protein, partial [Candidatus Cloacimonetes bacterium]|nr:insulinase family protein [Candidatus Cloacimonadota bacterium]
AFDSSEVAREKEVILKEIVYRSTPPRSKMYQKYRELIYPNSNKRYPVIGYTNLFKTISREDLADYYHKRYAPNNMVFVAVGDFVAANMIKKIEDIFKDFQREQIEPVYLPSQAVRNGTIEYVYEFDIKQPQTFITSILPEADYVDGLAINTALDILFGNRKSPIRYKLVEEEKLVNKIYAYAHYEPTSPEGTITIYFEPVTTKDITTIVKIIDAELEKYAYKGIEDKDIEKVINQYRADHLLATPGVQEECNRIGWSIIYYGVPDYYETQIEQLKTLKVEDIEQALQEYLLPANRVIYSAVPKGKKEILSQQELAQAEIDSAKKYIIDDNITLIYKKNTTKPIITGYLYLPISSNYETKSNVGVLSFMAEQMFKGSKDYKPLDFSEWKENTQANLGVDLNNIGTFINFKCLKKDFPELKKRLKSILEEPAFEKSELSLAKQTQKANYKNSLSSARSRHIQFRNSVLYKGERAGVPDSTKLEIIQNLTVDSLRKYYDKYFNSQKATFTFFGDLSKKEAIRYSEDIFKSVPDKKIIAEEEYLQVPDIDSFFVNKYQFEQVNMDLNFPAPSIGDKYFHTFEVISRILSGSRGRLHEAVRGGNDLAYFAYSQHGNSNNYGFFRISSQTSPAKKEELLKVLKNEIEKLKTDKVLQEEIDSAINEHKKMISSYLNINHLPKIMTRNCALGLGYNYLQESIRYLKEVTPEDIQMAAKKYLKNCAVIISEPSEDVELTVD